MTTLLMVVILIGLLFLAYQSVKELIDSIKEKK